MSAPVINPQTLDALLRDRDAVQLPSAQVAALRAAGCELRESSAGCFRLLRTSLSVWADYLSWRLPLPGRGRIIEIYRQTGSTQDVIRRLIAAHGAGADGALVATDEQTAGRGRLGRKWHAPPGWSVLLSRAVVRGSRDVARDGDAAREVSRDGEVVFHGEQFALVSAVAVALALEKLVAGVRVRIKWPNDIFMDGRKVAGILVESLPASAAAIIGVGINVTHVPAAIPSEVRDRFGSLDMYGFTGDRLAVLAAVADQLDTCLAPDADVASMLATWRAMNLYGGNERITFNHDGNIIRGCVIDLDAREGLMVRTEEGQIVHLPAATTSVVVEQGEHG